MWKNLDNCWYEWQVYGGSLYDFPDCLKIFIIKQNSNKTGLHLDSELSVCEVPFTLFILIVHFGHMGDSENCKINPIS